MVPSSVVEILLTYELKKHVRPEQTLTVFHEDVGHLLGQAVSDEVLVGLHHVGAEDLLVAVFGHVGSGRSGVSFQQVGAAFLKKTQAVGCSVEATRRAVTLILSSLTCVYRF